MLGQFEIEFLKFLESIRTPFLVKLAEIITMLGEETVFIALAAILYFIIDKKYGQKLIFIVCGGTCLTNVVKNFAKVPRPFVKDTSLHAERTETATGYSFPSGHTQNAGSWMTSLACKLKKTWAYLLAGLLMILVGLSRLFLGVHYPSDVLVGLLLGILSAAFFGWLFDRWENKIPLFTVMTGVFLALGIFFLFQADPWFDDYFKMFGFTFGFFLAYLFETKQVNFTNDGPVWKRIIRCVVGVGLALGLKVGLSALFGLIPAGVVGQQLLHWTRYALLAFFCLGAYPWLFKKAGL
ncbi:MAG: phosphatase PAP2 family protein [Clostridia bacterium]|nr:phosphatase PAP2 family protein [Clostridia bacterium]